MISYYPIILEKDSGIKIAVIQQQLKIQNCSFELKTCSEYCKHYGRVLLTPFMKLIVYFVKSQLSFV